MESMSGTTHTTKCRAFCRTGEVTDDGRQVESDASQKGSELAALRDRENATDSLVTSVGNPIATRASRRVWDGMVR